jgi:PKD domain
MNRSQKIIMILIVLTFVLPWATPAQEVTWKEPMVIDNAGGHSFDKPEIKFDPSGAVYITYRKRYPNKNSDIWMCRYDGKEKTYLNVSETGTVFNTFECYESAVEITDDGIVHIAWVALDLTQVDKQYIQYRNYNPSIGTWSDIVNMNTFHVHEDDFVFDLRLGVSNNGNAHVIYMLDEAKNTYYVAKYGDVVQPAEQIGGQKYKHPDIAVDDNYVHIIYQKLIGWPYVIMYIQKENQPNGAELAHFQLTYPNEGQKFASQKARIALDSFGLAHVMDFHKHGPTNTRELLYYEQRTDGTWTEDVRVSDPNNLRGYHWAAMALRNDDIITTMQLGSTTPTKGGLAIYYNWKKSGQWLGYGLVTNTSGVLHQAVDMSHDGEIAACAFVVRENAIMMTSTGDITATGTLETNFNHPDNIFAGDTVTFDASESIDLNPDVNITSYTWDFGDGTIITTTSPTTTHAYNTYDQDFDVILTISSADEATGTIAKTIHVKALYSAIIDAVNSKRIRTLFYSRVANEVLWSANQKNVDEGLPTITKFEIWRALSGSVLTEADYQKVGEVNASIFSYFDYNGLVDGSTYVYVIRSVDADGHRSPIDKF